MIILLGRNLPKWPQMLTVGQPVTGEQAKEVIRRTDHFFVWPEYSGNDKAYCAWVIAKLGIPAAAVSCDPASLAQARERRAVWRQEWGLVETGYVHNDWISCSYIFGPHGWMNPDGRILFVDNVGKWPTVGEILADWTVLARAFPFVQLDSVLMDREHGEEGREPVVGFHVEGGKVEVFDPAGEAALVSSMMQTGDAVEASRLFLPNEQGIPRSWIKEWGKRKGTSQLLA